MEARIRAVIDDALAKRYTRPGRVVVMGSSRHGFAILHSMALNADVSAAVAHQPVIHWPRMSEFTGMDDNEIVKRNGLFPRAIASILTEDCSEVISIPDLLLLRLAAMGYFLKWFTSLSKLTRDERRRMGTDSLSRRYP